MSKIVLGTAQLGSNYGITNKNPEGSIEKTKKIIEFARKKGIDTLDTAMDYAFESQSSSVSISDFNINTKLPKVPEKEKKISNWIEKKVEQSMKNLEIKKINCLLLHNPNQLQKKGGEEIWKTLKNLKKKDLVKKIGISIYDTNKVEKYLSEFKPDVIQSPFNIIDRRVLHSNWLKKAKKKGVEIQVRSIFLQGILLLDKDELPKEFHKWKPIWKKMSLFLKKRNYTKLQLLISFVQSFKEIDNVIVGVDNLTQLEEILDLELIKINGFPDLSSRDEKLINPLNWPLYKKNKKDFLDA